MGNINIFDDANNDATNYHPGCKRNFSSQKTFLLRAYVGTKL